MQLVWYDWLMLAIIVFMSVRGAIKGFVWQLATIGAIVLCFTFAGTLSESVAPVIPLGHPLNRWAAMFLLYVGFSFLTFALARSLRNGLEKAKFTEYDRHLGGVFGLIKGLILCLVITFFTVTLSEPLRSQVMDAQSGRYAALLMDRLHPVMSDEFHDIVEPYIHNLDHDDLDLKHSHHDDEHSHGHDDALGDDSFFSDSNQDGHSHEDPFDSSSHDSDQGITSILKKLPGIVDSELAEMVRRAYSNTDPEDRSELVKQLSTQIPGMIRKVASEWQFGKPQPEDVPQPKREKQLGEIAAIYSDYPNAQDEIVEELQEILNELPLKVADRVVADWHADLLNSGTDPNPETTHLTSLNERIRQELKFARVPISSLNDELRTRLWGVSRQ